ncbi:MAG: hypothetical protein HKO53_19625 [Gemmatimonadetes bacterium]|nr:hypothetical protein [Gemmatimonadota bacterium]
MATLVGSIRATATTAPAARLLEVEIRSSNGGGSRSGYLAAVDLEAAPPEELERLVSRPKPESPSLARGAGRREERRKGRSPGSS